MDINEIKRRYAELNTELKHSLGHMEKTEKVFLIRDAIKDLQALCPHNNGNYDFSTEDKCPYCGKQFKG